MTEHHGNDAVASRRRAPEPVPDRITLRADDGATAEIHRHGAHVTSWRPAPDGEERLFLSAISAFGEGAAIRGGIPMIFPQFAAEGPLPRHGFARTTTWSIGGVARSSNGMAEADFVLRDTDTTRAIWDARFTAVVKVCVLSEQLAVTLDVENVGDAPFSFTAALHTYLRVQDTSSVEIIGLRGTRYRVTGDDALLRDDDERLRVRDYLDRVYVNAPPVLELRDGAHTLTLESEGFTDAVVWNPGAERAAALTDLEPGGEKRFVCIEAAVVQTPVTIGPRRKWIGTQTLTARAR